MNPTLNPIRAALLTLTLLAILPLPAPAATAFAQTRPATRANDLDDPGLNAAIAGLGDPAQRYASFRKLVLYFWSYPHSSAGIMMSYGDPSINARLQRAGEAMGKASDIALVKLALADPDRTMQWWAIGAAGGVMETSRGNDPRADITDPEALALLPIVRKFCTSDDERIRRQAENALTWIHSEHEFLQKILQDETSPENVMFLLTANGLTADYPAKMNTHLVRLLNSPDPKIRARAMAFITWNSNMAEMFHCAFSVEVRDQVLALSTQSADRAAAPSALAVFYPADPPRLLALLKEMSADKDPAVRQSTAVALFANDRIPEFHALLLGMINDSDDTVRLSALEAAGPESHLPELRALAASKDHEVANVASTILKRIEDHNKSP